MHLKFKYSKPALSFLLSMQMAVGPFMAHAGTESGAISTSANNLYKEVDPVWQKFVDADPTGFNLTFSTQDPALDQDPFFMRSQGWKAANDKVAIDKVANLSFLKNALGLEIVIPNAESSLLLRRPLSPIQSTEDFIFLALDATSDIFKTAAGPQETSGEGLFFISRADLLYQSREGKPVPIFFFPLSGKWTGPVSSLQFPQIDAVVFSNGTESVAVELRDVETAMKAQQINLTMAAALSAKNRGLITKEMYPAPGMTAAFGLFFTGIDLQVPEKSMWSSSARKSDVLFGDHFYQNLLKKVSRWIPVSVAPAQAFFLPPELIARLVFVGSVLTGMLAASLVIKYCHPGIRKKIKSLRADVAPTKNPLKIAKREIKETFDVFAAMTTLSAQVASVTFANSLELFLDRFAPTVAAADHSLVRRFLKNTFYFSRDSMRSVPVNSRTFVLGALVMGSVDTAMVAVQYQVAVPYIAQAASSHLGPDMQARIDATFDPQNPNTKQIALQDTVRNGIGYLQTGASSYSTEARGQVIDSVSKEVEDAMRAQGKDPADPKYQSEKERRVEEKINITMKQKGLPDSSNFLFDANTVFNVIPKMLGYKTPEDMQVQESFVLEKRFGLSKNALNRAIQVATEWVKNDSSNVSREALALLEETAREMKFFKNAMVSGRQGVQQARKARQQLTLLSYEGSIEYAIKYVPETWSKKYSAEAAQAAGLMFRQSLYSYLSQEGDDLLFANSKNIEKFGTQAKQKALAELKNNRPEIETGSPMSADTGFELKLRTQIEINNLARAQKIQDSAEKFAPPKLDWLARRKQARALLETENRMNDYLQSTEGVKASDSQLAAAKQKFFRDALARQIGLYIEDRDVALAQGREDYVKMIDLVEQKSVEETANEIKSDPNMAKFFEKSAEAEKEKMKMFLYANNFFQKYKEATTDLELAKPTDPAQPGRFQRLRQTEMVRSSPFLTRSLRTLEAFGDDQSMKLGMGGAIMRNVPLARDLLSAHQRMIKTILPIMSIGYLWNFYAWQVHIPFATWTLFAVSVAGTIATPSQWLNRVFRLNGLKAMDSVASKIAYAVPYAWVTFAGMFPIMLFSGDFGAFFSDAIRTPVMSVLEKIEMKDWLFGLLATGVVASKIKSQAGTDISEKSTAIKNFLEPRRSKAMSCEELF